MKHAYLILAHADFDLLVNLITCLDVFGNHIFVHFDKKVASVPLLSTKFAQLTVLSSRVRVYWGDVSVVKAEISLFTAAYKVGGFDYYHLISGTDLPIKTPEDITYFFEKNRGKEFIGFEVQQNERASTRKARYYHLFPTRFSTGGTATGLLLPALRKIFLECQIALGAKRNNGVIIKKGTQWVSITTAFVELILLHKVQVLKVFSHTYCPDEMYKQTLIWSSPLKKNVFNMLDEGQSCMREINWKNNRLHYWTLADYERLESSEMLFARKFTSDEAELLSKVVKNLAQRYG